jgi:hypothetical protein
MAEPFAYGGQTILSHPIFVETILPFVLIFTVVFAILQKSKILGEGKTQIDAIVALIVGLLVISFAQFTGVILQLIPFMAVALVILFILMILLGAVAKGDKPEDLLPTWLWYTLVPIITVAVIVAVLVFSGAWDYLYDLVIIGGDGDSTTFMNIVFFVIIIGAMVAVMIGARKASGKGGD